MKLRLRAQGQLRIIGQEEGEDQTFTVDLEIQSDDPAVQDNEEYIQNPGEGGEDVGEEIQSAADEEGGSIVISIDDDAAEKINGLNFQINEDDGEGFQRVDNYLPGFFENVDDVESLYKALTNNDSWEGDSPFDQTIDFEDAYDEEEGELTLTLEEVGHSIEMADGYDAPFAFYYNDKVKGFEEGDSLDFSDLGLTEDNWLEDAIDIDPEIDSPYEAAQFAAAKLEGDDDAMFGFFELDGHTYIYGNLGEEDTVSSDDLMVKLAGVHGEDFEVDNGSLVLNG